MTIRTYRRRVPKRLMIGVVTTATLLAACGGGSDADSTDDQVIVVEGADDATGTASAVTDDSTPTASGSDEAAAREFADCMRDNGVDDFPDPTVSADGSVDFGGGAAGGGGGAAPAFLEDTDFEAAAEECNSVLEGASFLPDEADETELQDSLLEAAQCLRDQGLDVDDPDLAAGGEGGLGAPGGGGPFGDEFDPDEPEVAAAIEACQDVFGGLDAPGAG